jgi:hypothetical protein
MDNVEVLQSKEAGSRRLFEEDELKWLDEEEFDARVIADKFVMHQADKSLVPGVPTKQSTRVNTFGVRRDLRRELPAS